MTMNKMSAFTILLLYSSLLSAAGAAETLSKGPSAALPVVAFGVAAFVVVALLATGLTLWIRKQEQINNIMYFCLDFLVNAKNETERRRAATELGRANDPRALLVLVDVINDESVEEGIREAARDALLDMGEKRRGFNKPIAGLMAAAEAKDHERTVELLMTYFEQGEQKYVQSAYMIGRDLVRIEKYADAREWLRIAEARNSKFPMYMNQIGELTDRCNRQLFAAGDAAFKAGDFHLANENLALAVHGLSTGASKQFAYYLRAACVYCKLEEYENASDALLQALHHEHETDTALALNTLVDKMLDLIKEQPDSKEERAALSRELDRFVDQTMASLSARHPETR